MSGNGLRHDRVYFEDRAYHVGLSERGQEKGQLRSPES